MKFDRAALEAKARTLRVRDLHQPGPGVPIRRGYSAVGTGGGRASFVHHSRAGTVDTEVDGIRIKEFRTPPTKQEIEFRVPVMRRRTPLERVESLTKRLAFEVGRMRASGASEVAVAGLVEAIAGEYWKAGMPVTTDRLREIAGRYMLAAENKAEATARRQVTRVG